MVNTNPKQEQMREFMDLKYELCERLRSLGQTVGPTEFWASIADRVERATITEPAPPDAVNPKWPRVVVNYAIDMLEIRACNAGDIALAKNARECLVHLLDPTKPKNPTDAERLDALRQELGGGVCGLL